LGERLLCKQKVAGSIPVISTGIETLLLKGELKMSKAGKQMVCVLDENEVIEWIEKINKFSLELAKQYIVNHYDLAKVSDITPLEQFSSVDIDGITYNYIKGVEIDFFVEE